MDKILLAKSTNKLVKEYLANPSHAVMLVGDYGSGRSYLANCMIMKLFNVKILDNLPYFINIKPTKNVITIDVIRELQSKLKLLVPNKKSPNRVMLIEEAQTMTDEAQNALLKTLEEPAIGTVIILTVTNEKSVLETIVSRAQVLKINKVSTNSIIDYYSNAGYKKSEIEKAVLISDGRMGLIKNILDDEENEVINSINNAKSILSLNRFERIIVVNDYKDREAAIGLVEAFCTLSRAALRKSNTESQIRWQKLYKQAFEAKEQLTNNAGPKIVLTNLFYKI